MKLAQVAYSKNINPGKLAQFAEQAGLYGRRAASRAARAVEVVTGGEA